MSSGQPLFIKTSTSPISERRLKSYLAGYLPQRAKLAIERATDVAAKRATDVAAGAQDEPVDTAAPAFIQRGKRVVNVTLAHASAAMASSIKHTAPDEHGNRWITRLDDGLRPQQNLLILDAPHASALIPFSSDESARLHARAGEVTGKVDLGTEELLLAAHRQMGAPSLLAKYSKSVANLNRTIGHPAAGAYRASDTSLLSNRPAYAELFRNLQSILQQANVLNGKGKIARGKRCLLLSLHAIRDDKARDVATLVRVASAKDPHRVRQLASPLRQRERVDVVLGTRFGRLANFGVAQALKSALEQQGLKVAIDFGYVGDSSREQIKSVFGRGFSAIQVEIGHHAYAVKREGFLRGLTAFQHAWNDQG